MDHQKEFLLKILEITEFASDKESFAQMFISLVMEDAVYNLIHSLPKIKQDKIARQWDNNTNNHAALVSILNHYFKPEQLEKAAEEASSKAIIGYISSIEDSLDDTKREKLRKLSEEYTSTS
jgi:hypothetical protein